jgi:hypothetical protein
MVAVADNVTVLTASEEGLHVYGQKLEKFCEWSIMMVRPDKCKVLLRMFDWHGKMIKDPQLECYEPSLQPCEHTQSIHRQRSPWPLTRHRYLAHRSCYHAIVILSIAVAIMQSTLRTLLYTCMQGSRIQGWPPLLQLHSPIAQSLVASIYRDHLPIPMSILVLALNS